MIVHLELQLQLPPGEKFRPSLAYALYGALCDYMSADLAEAFHAQEITPLRQHLRPGPAEGQCTWLLDLFDGAQELTDTLRKLQQIPLHCYKAPLQVLGLRMTEPISVPELIVDAQTWPGNTAAEIVFETPCTFKVAGEYALFPAAERIVQSLFFRWNALVPECSLEDQDALRLLASGLRIQRYRLFSQNYWMKGQKIPGFTGSVQITARLPTPMLELWHLLLSFAPYGGVGIKPALGMGAVNVRPVHFHRKAVFLR